MSTPPTIVVHDLTHALAALAAAEEAGCAIRIESAPGAAAQGGAAWFNAVLAEARAAHPKARALAVLDCGAEPGLALGAIRAGAEAILTAAPGPARTRIAAIARAAGVRIEARPKGRRLDLLDAPDPLAAARTFLLSGRRSNQLQKRRGSAIPDG